MRADSAYQYFPLRRFVTEMTDGPFGSSLTSSHYADEGARVIRLGNIGIGGFRNEDAAYISMDYFGQLKRHEARAGDLVIAGLGDVNHPVGRACIVPRGIGPAIVKADCFRVRLDERRLTHKYAMWALHDAASSGYTTELSHGSTRARINVETARSILLPVPPVEEQRRIADFLDAETARIDHLSRLRSRQVERINERYRLAISELTTPGISSDHERHVRWPWLPAEIPIVRLGYLAQVQTGVTVHGSREQSPGDREYPYLRVANVQGERVDLSEVKTIVLPASMALRSTLQPGDVVMTEANGNPDNLGRGAVWHGEIPGMVHQNHIFAIRADKRTFLPEYLSALLASSHGRRYFRHTSSQVGIATTSSSKVRDFPIPKLTINQQKEIVDRYQAEQIKTQRATETLYQQLELLAERRQALITAVVTGQFDVSTASGRGVTE